VTTNLVYRRGPGFLLALVLIAIVTLAPALEVAAKHAQGPDLFSITNVVPGSEAVVPAGTRTIAADVFGQSIERVTVLLNTEVLAVTTTGTRERLHVSADRVLAPGEYTVAVVAEDLIHGRRSVTWRFTVQATSAQLPIPAGFSQLDAKIQIVFPHDAAPVTEAQQANIATVLFAPGTALPVPCNFGRTVRLWRALNSDPAEQVAVGQRVIRTVDGTTFPVWEFNDVDVSAANDPENKIFFFVAVDDSGTNSNVWVHGADPRTTFPFQDVPAAVAPWPATVDAKIEIVYPHDAAPVAEAQRANIGVDLFARGTLQSVDTSRNPFVHLVRSLNADVATYGGTGQRIAHVAGGVLLPRWVFNDINVGAANTPSNLILFRTVVEGVTTFPNLWAHGADVRTVFPVQDVPSQSCQGSLP
jgi:hypothetical protein